MTQENDMTAEIEALVARLLDTGNMTIGDGLEAAAALPADAGEGK